MFAILLCTPPSSIFQPLRRREDTYWHVRGGLCRPTNPIIDMLSRSAEFTLANYSGCYQRLDGTPVKCISNLSVNQFKQKVSKISDFIIGQYLGSNMRKRADLNCVLLFIHNNPRDSVWVSSIEVKIRFRCLKSEREPGSFYFGLWNTKIKKKS